MSIYSQLEVSMIVTDEFINELFINTNFGKPINDSIRKKKYLLGETLKHLTEGYWVGHTAFHIALDGGFIKDGKKSEPKELTAFGNAFITQLAE